jgi:hypothetical protein
MPPPRKTSSTDLARGPRGAAACASFSAENNPPSDRPKGASAPTRRKSRRDQPLHQRFGF